MLRAQPLNDASTAPRLLISDRACSNTAGTLINATKSLITYGCGNSNSPDVWYSFVAKTGYPRINLNSIGANLASNGAVIQLLSGTVGGTGLLCSAATISGNTTLGLQTNNLTIGTLYYIRISTTALSAVVTSGSYNFNICVTDALLDFSKSFTNITDGAVGGGSIKKGDILEIRATFVLNGDASIPLTNVQFFDTLKANVGFAFKDSIATRTNEGKMVRTFTTAVNDDQGWLITTAPGFDTIVRINVGPLANSNDISGGGTIRSNTRPSFYGGTCIIMATYRVTVSGATGSKINYGGGAFRYTVVNSSGTPFAYTISFPRDSLVVLDDLQACSDAVAPANLIGNANNGTFGTLTLGSTATLAQQNGGAAAINTSYTYSTIGASSPQDYFYGVVNNTSATNSAINTVPKGDPSRVFTLWDITGDHTNATNLTKGNPPCDITKPVSTANPCGYLLAVNAAYRTDVAFEYSVTGACSETYYEVSAWFKNVCSKCGCDSTGAGAGGPGFIPTSPGDSSGVRPNIAIQIDGLAYYTTGDIFYTGYGGTQRGSDTLNKWIRKSFVFKTNALQTNFKITFRNNAPGGGGNDWVVDDIALRTCYPSMIYSPPNPIVNIGSPLTIRDTVRSYFDNYTYYQWQRAPAANPTAFANITGASGVATVFLNALYNQYEYVVSYTIPGTATLAVNSGDLYRLLVATNAANLISGCTFSPSTTFGLYPANAPCAFSATNFAIAPQSTQIDWNKLDWSLGHIPTCCESAFITYTGTKGVNDTVTVNITNDICIINLTLVNNSSQPNQVFKTILHPTYNMLMRGNVRMGAPASATTDSCIFISRGGGTITVQGNTVIGYVGDNATSIIGTFPGTATYANYLLLGDSLTFNTKGIVNHKFTSVTLDPSSGSASLVNNTNAAIYPNAITFDRLFIGNDNAKTVTAAGTTANSFLNDNGGKLDVSIGSTLVLPANYSINARSIVTAGAFNSSLFLDPASTLRLGGITNGITGSNFPANYNINTLNATSTVEFFGAAQSLPGSLENILLYGNITLAGSGAKTASAGDIFLAGNLYRKSGTHTFNANGGRFTFVSAINAQRYYADAGTTQANFYDFTNNNTFSSGLFIDSTIGVVNQFELKPSTTITLNTGDIILRSSAIRTAHVKNLGAIIPAIVYNTTYRFVIERYLYGEKAWRFLSAPVLMAASDAGTPSISSSWRENNASLTSNGYGTAITGPTGLAGELDYYTQRGSMKYYDDVTNNYVELSNTTTTKVANTQGYMLFVRGDRGAPNNSNVLILGTPTTLRTKGKIRTSSQSFNILATRFQSVGNPFASQINFSTTGKTNMVNGFVSWNPVLTGLYGVGGFENYSLVGANLRLNGLATGFIKNTIESGEAIFIQNNLGVAGSLSIQETDKGTSNFLVSRTTTNDIELPTLDVKLFHKNTAGNFILVDGLSSTFGDSFSGNIDNNDVVKFTNTYDNLFIKSKGRSLVVEKRPKATLEDTVRLGITGMAVASYRFQFDPYVFQNSKLDAYLVDKYLNKTTLVTPVDSTNIDFEVTADAGSKNQDRFMIVFKSIPPVNLLDVSAFRTQSKSAEVRWKAEAERAVKHYVIERSADSIHFDLVSTQAPKSNSGTDINYMEEDELVSKAKNWYRIKALSSTGQVSYSEIVSVDELVDSKIYAYPNPLKDGNLTLNFNMQRPGNYSLQVMNAMGQIVKMQTVYISGIKEQHIINLVKIAAGTYTISITSETKNVTTLVFVKQ